MLSQQLMYCMCTDKQFALINNLHKVLFFEDYPVHFFVRAICHSIVLHTIYVVYLAVALIWRLGESRKYRQTKRTPSWQQAWVSFHTAFTIATQRSHQLYIRANRQIFNSPNNFTYTVVCLWF